MCIFDLVATSLCSVNSVVCRLMHCQCNDESRRLNQQILLCACSHLVATSAVKPGFFRVFSVLAYFEQNWTNLCNRNLWDTFILAQRRYNCDSLQKFLSTFFAPRWTCQSRKLEEFDTKMMWRKCFTVMVVMLRQLVFRLRWLLPCPRCSWKMVPCRWISCRYLVLWGVF